MAGGVALNCVGNGRILREGPFKRLWIQPAAGDAGGALGVAQLIWHRHAAQPRSACPGHDRMNGFVPGARIQRCPDRTVPQRKSERHIRVLNPPTFTIVLQLCWRDEHVIGWFDGRMEFGPRALGARSILGDPRSPRMQAQMNLKIKFREGFRPFAPSVLRERLADYFELDVDSPYMLLVAPVCAERRLAMTPEQEKFWGIEKLNVARSDLPAITHVDYLPASRRSRARRIPTITICSRPSSVGPGAGCW